VIQVRTSASFASAKKYVWDFILLHFVEDEIEWLWDLPYEGWEIQISESENTWSWQDDFFHQMERHWLKQTFRPPLNDQGILFEDSNDHNDLATIFYFLSHYEECVFAERDEHGRIKATSTWIFQHGAHLQPLVNKAAERFVDELTRQFPTIARKKKKMGFRVTHDVDRPFQFGNGKSGWSDIKVQLGNFIASPFRLTSFVGLIRAVLHPFLGKRVDPYYTFQLILQWNQSCHSVPYFYWIPRNEHPQWDSHYNLKDLRMKELFQMIHQQGGRSGMHPNYTSSENSTFFNEQFRIFSQWRDGMVGNESVINRQHFLRFDPMSFPSILSSAGVVEDSSYGYAETIGWRASCTYPYYLFDLMHQCSTTVLEVPLCAMDVSIFSSRYMNQPSPDAILEVLKSLIPIIEQHGGVYCLLWHNDSLSKTGYDKVYKEILHELSQRLNG